jgi:hypothetical protein
MRKIEKALAFLLTANLGVGLPFLEGCNKAEKGATAQPQAAPTATYAKPSPDELYQLVAPIALFPDNLVAQVLAGSTYPDQINTAGAWLKQNANLKGDDLLQAADKEPWDVSVKALTQFPDVLNQMASNLAWTSALGDAYFNIPQDVMNAVQVMRQRASDAGNLKSNQQQSISTEKTPPPAAAQSGSSQPTVVQAPPETIVIQPAQPQVVYVPSYNPTVVYGAPVAVYPGYVPPPPPSTGEVIAAGLITFGVGMAVGAAISNNSCCGWGWNSWGCGWHSSSVTFNRNVYVSNSTTFVNRNNYYNRNNVNVNNLNVNNVNRNNVNRNNINRNNVNNNNYRANNFNNTSRNSNFTTPTFGTQRNQAQFQNARATAPEQRNQQLGAANRSNVNAQNRAGLGQSDTRPQVNQQNRTGFSQNNARPQANQQNRPNVSQTQRDNARGYGDQQARSANSGAFGNPTSGGNARVNSARGQQSLSGSRSSGARTSNAKAGRRH